MFAASLVMLVATAVSTETLAAEAKRILVMELRSDGDVSADEASTLTGMVAAELAQRPGVFVISGEEIGLIADLEGDEEFKRCTDYRCLAEVAGALGVEYVLFGWLASAGSGYLVKLSLADVERGELTAQSDFMLSSMQQVSAELGLATAPILDALDRHAVAPAVTPPVTPPRTPETPAESTVPPPEDSAISWPLLLGGVGLGAVGVLVAGATTVVGLQLNERVVNAANDGGEKDEVLGYGAWLVLGGGAASALCLLGGGALAALGLVE